MGGSCVLGAYDFNQSATSVVVLSSDPQCNTPDPFNTSLCGFSVQYGSGSAIQGAWVQDLLSFNHMSSPVMFGQILETQFGFQEPPAAGIFGLAYDILNQLSANIGCGNSTGLGTTQFPTALTAFLQGQNMTNELSMCVGSPNHPGVLSLGGVNPAHYTGPIQYTQVDVIQWFLWCHHSRRWAFF
jgi:hypothetical protein